MSAESLTIERLLASESLRRSEFPVAEHQVFLAHAGVCPLPARVTRAIGEYATRATQGDQEQLIPDRLLSDTRALAARMIHAEPEEIALVGPTSLALSYVASGIPFRRGDNVLVYFDDYPSNVYPWMALAEKGVEVRLMNIRELGRIRPIDVTGQVDERTRLVALASCHFLSGYRIEIDAIGRALRDRKILFCVDGIQTLGAFPTTVEHVDFLAADAHKWMLGPSAAGILYVRRPLQELLRPPIFGWHNIRCPNFIAQESIEPLPDARRYEAGSFNFLGIVGMKAGMELILEVGIDAIARELLRKRSVLVAQLQGRGFTVLHANVSPQNCGGMVSCFRPGADMAAFHSRLLESGVVASLRSDRAGQRYLRFSPHFYNTDAEIERALGCLG